MAPPSPDVFPCVFPPALGNRRMAPSRNPLGSSAGAARVGGKSASLCVRKGFWVCWHLFRRYQENSPRWGRGTSHGNNTQSVRLCLFYLIIISCQGGRIRLDPLYPTEVQLYEYSALRGGFHRSALREKGDSDAMLWQKSQGKQGCSEHKAHLGFLAARKLRGLMIPSLLDLGSAIDVRAGWGLQLSSMAQGRGCSCVRLRSHIESSTLATALRTAACVTVVGPATPAGEPCRNPKPGAAGGCTAALPPNPFPGWKLGSAPSEPHRRGRARSLLSRHPSSPSSPPSCSGGESKPPRGAGDALPFPSLPSSRSEAGWAVMLRGFPGCSEGAPLPPAAGISPLGGPSRGLAAGGGRSGGGGGTIGTAPRSRAADYRHPGLGERGADAGLFAACIQWATP